VAKVESLKRNSVLTVDSASSNFKDVFEVEVLYPFV